MPASLLAEPKLAWKGRHRTLLDQTDHTGGDLFVVASEPAPPMPPWRPASVMLSAQHVNGVAGPSVVQTSGGNVSVQLNNQDPIDEKDPAVRVWLNKLQGNILRGHGRDNGVYILFSLSENVALARKIVKELATRYVRSALAQYQDTVAYRLTRQDGPVFANLLLTANGYRRLGLDPDGQFLEPAEAAPHGHDPVSTFVSGMQAAEDDLGDPPIGRWDAGYQQQIDGILLLAADTEKERSCSTSPTQPPDSSGPPIPSGQ